MGDDLLKTPLRDAVCNAAPRRAAKRTSRGAWLAAATLGSAGLGLGFSSIAATTCDLAAMTETARHSPNDAQAHVARAACLMTPTPNGRKPPLKDVEAAVHDLERAIRLDPRNFYARHNYGHAAYLLGQGQIAVAEFTKAIALQPNSARSYLGRGFASLQLCKVDDAAPDFDRATRLDATMRARVPDAQTLAFTRSQCRRPIAPGPGPARRASPWSPGDPYFDRNSDYWRQRRWESRPH